jgi:hypothetical protein
MAISLTFKGGIAIVLPYAQADYNMKVRDDAISAVGQRQ